MFMKPVARVLVLLAALSIGGRDAHAIETMAEYADVPFFMSNSVMPNIMVIADNSGSMNEFAYSAAYDPARTYSGYFSASLHYSYDGTKFVINAAGPYLGSFLNWACMRKIDVARKVLVGGLATSRTGGGNQVNKGESSPTGWNQQKNLTVTQAAGTTAYNPGGGIATYIYYLTAGSLKVYKTSVSAGNLLATYNVWIQKDSTQEPDDFVSGNLSGIMQKVSTKARWGLAFFDSSSNGGYVAEPIVGPGYGTNFITTYENKAPATMTPLAETLYQVLGYFKQDASMRFAPGNYTTNVQGKDPFWYSDSNAYVRCGKNFVVLITDGEPTSDTNIPAALQDYDGDGQDAVLWPNSGSDYLDDVALWGHTVDLRADIADTQVITLYSVYTFGTSAAAKTLLKNAAKNGAFVDSNGNNRPDSEDINSNGILDAGEDTNGNGMLDSEWDTNADGIPDTYFEANDADSMESQLMAAITDILKRASSGTAISVLATSASGAGNIYQAYFLPSKTIIDALGTRDITWIGHLLSLKIDSKGSLLDKNSNCISFSFDTVAKETVINKLSGTAGACGTTVTATTQLTSFVDYDWDAGELLAATTASSRTIFTFLDVNKNNVVNGGEKLDFTTANAGTLQKYLRTSTVAEATNVINWVRGTAVTGYRDRTLNVGGDQWKLGDIIHSTPTVVGAPQENYSALYQDAGYETFYNANKDRTQVVYIGANDGMLHAFDATTGNPTSGKELWAYIPYNLLPHLKWLADPAYPHVDYVDLKVKISDINLGTKAAPNWKTVLIGGMRFGGGEITDTTYDVDGNGDTAANLRKWRSAFFAIDITDPAVPVPLWEWNPGDNTLGYSMTYPAVAKVGDEFFAIIGTGPKAAYLPDYTGTSAQTASLFVLNIKTGALAATFPISDVNSFFSDPITVDIDFNASNPVVGGTGNSYNTEAAYIGETYKTNGGVWNSRMWRLVTNPTTAGNDVNPANWKMYDMYTDPAGQTITSAPAATTDSAGHLWLFYGTGKFLNQADKADASQQTFYGIKDPCWVGSTGAWSTTCTWGSLNTAGSYSASVTSATLVNVTNAVVSTDAVNTVTGVTGATTFAGLMSLIATKDGWYMNLTTSLERALNKPSVIGGLVLFTTFVPDADACALGGNSWFYATYYETGSAYTSSVIGLGSGDTTVLRKSASSSVGMASSIAIHSGRESGLKAYVQMSTGQASVVEVTPASDINSGIIAWREL
ncbi:MAG: hypothetical protein HZA03_02595 [Nitrospinae bacterium]|nr:hypothetical protein [Nitrospinota bacterium]